MSSSTIFRLRRTGQPLLDGSPPSTSGWNSQATGGRWGVDHPELGPIVCAGLLVVLLGVQLILPNGQPAAEVSILAPRRPHLIGIPPLPEYAAISQAPLFAPDRRPGEAPGPGAGPLSAWSALGTATGGRVASAVMSGPGAVVKTVQRGEDVEGWRLVAVEKTRVVFERAGQKRELTVGAPAEALSDPKAAPAAAAEDQ